MCQHPASPAVNSALMAINPSTSAAQAKRSSSKHACLIARTPACMHQNNRSRTHAKPARPQYMAESSPHQQACDCMRPPALAKAASGLFSKIGGDLVAQNITTQKLSTHKIGSNQPRRIQQWHALTRFKVVGGIAHASPLLGGPHAVQRRAPRATATRRLLLRMCCQWCSRANQTHPATWVTHHSRML